MTISDSVPKILGGFQNYHSMDSNTYHGRRLEWGTFQHENENKGIWHELLTEGYCTLDLGSGYCYLMLVISSNIGSSETGYGIRGGYVDDGEGSVAMRWGVDATTPGLTDTVVAALDRIGLPSVNLHFMIQPIDGAFQFSDICVYQCAPNETFTSLRILEDSYVAREIANVKCWSIEMKTQVNCKLYIWDN